MRVLTIDGGGIRGILLATLLVVGRLHFPRRWDYPSGGAVLSRTTISGTAMLSAGRTPVSIHS